MSKLDPPAQPRVAVGVRYLPAYPAPLILFKARGHQANQVLQLARRLGVPETNDQVLAPLLFQLPEGSWIPEKHFAVLAELLAAVYSYGRNYHDESHSGKEGPGGQT